MATSLKIVAALLLVSLAVAAGRELQQSKPADAKPADAKPAAAGKPEAAAKAATVPPATNNKAALASVAQGLTSQPVVFVALIKLKEGADADKFIATRDAVAAKYLKNYPGMSVAYIRGSAPPKAESLPQGAAKVDYRPVAAIVSAPDEKTYKAYNAAIAKDADYVASGKDVEDVARTTNLQT